MSQADSIEPKTISRRTVPAMVTGAGIPGISGCYDESSTGGDESVSTPHREPDENKYSTVRTDLEEIFKEINELPIAENGEFVFDVKGFEENFDFENLLEETRTLQERLERMEPRSDTELEALRAVAKIAELRIQARLTTHQAIAAGLSYGNRLSREEYAGATEAIQDGRRFFEELVGTIREIENEMGQVPNDSVPIDEFEPDSIWETRSVILEIVQWSAMIYRSFEYASVGFELFENAAGMIEDERVQKARTNFESAVVQFSNARKVLGRAHGRGRRLGYIVPLVRKLRCILPIYRDTSYRFADSFNAWKSGEENEARSIARKVMEGVDQRMAQCGDSEEI